VRNQPRWAPLPDRRPGLILGDFQTGYSPNELFYVGSTNASVISRMVTGLVTVDGNSKGSGRGIFVIDRRIGPYGPGMTIQLADGKIQITQTD